ncbi:MAG: hypothetical protein IT448_07915 [Phycisphaerales bacterium]|nr:hypothetical protein [Phycisphaerales bacterium]
MAKNKNDDLARALEAMMSGQAPQADPVDAQPAEKMVKNPSIAKPVQANHPAPASTTRPSVPNKRPVSGKPAGQNPQPTRPTAPKPVTTLAPAKTPAMTKTPERALSSGSRPTQTAVPLFRRLSFRRTIIPPMLTLAFILPLFGLMPLIASDESPWAAISSWVSYCFILLGLVMAALTIMNILLVRQQLRLST